MPHPDQSWLIDILNAALRIRRIMKGLDRAAFQEDETRSLAVERLLEIMGEATKNLSPEFRSANSALPWRAMAGMRDFLIHSYRRVDPDIVWDSATKSVPAVIAGLEPLIAELNAEDSP